MPTHGILLLDKPSGLTSNGALSRAKRILGIKKAGHTGALDPMATGLLPLCFGQATKVSQFLLESDKQYLADIQLGQTTTSGDADGEVIDERDLPELNLERVEAVLDRFRGSIEQIPPMVSALKYKGQRLHELARQGIEVERPPRRVIIHQLDLLEQDAQRLTVRVQCSKGTYIRSLAVDIGEVIGCGAHLSRLRREKSGPFSLGNAITLDQLLKLEQESARARLLPPDQALVHLNTIHITQDQAKSLRYGQPVPLDHAPTTLIRIYADNDFVGVATVDEEGILRSKRLFDLTM
ncbi:MAG: tRNA pseudouridine(55) synthase TruB [Pseudomonadota bacterium]